MSGSETTKARKEGGREVRADVYRKFLSTHEFIALCTYAWQSCVFGCIGMYIYVYNVTQIANASLVPCQSLKIANVCLNAACSYV